MRCKKVIRQLSAYLDGQLTAAEREVVRSHIAGCARCRGELEALGRTVYAVADLPRLQAPSDLRDQVMAKLDGVAPAQARPPRWRMYWGAAAAVVLAVVIMLLPKSPAPRRTVVAEAVAPAAKNTLSRDVAPVNKGAIEPPGRAAGSSVVPAFENTTVAPASSEQIVLPSSNPRTAYFNAAAIAAKGGWLPAELQKKGAVSDQLKADQVGHPAQVLQLTFRMKRDQVPLLKGALAAAGLPAAVEKGGRGEELKEADESAPRAAYARTAPEETPRSSIAAAAPPAPAETEVAGSLSGAAAVSRRQPVAEKAVQRTEAATPLSEARKAEAAEEPLVQVTLLFPLAESPVPAAPPAAGAASSVTPE